MDNSEKQVSIIIPYKGTEKELFPLLSSLRYQIGVLFHKVECILINYGTSNTFRKDFLELFVPVNFRCILDMENSSFGAACQKGINVATGDYLLFCNTGDILYDGSVLNILLTELKNEPDIIFSQWIEEFLDPDTGAFACRVYNPESVGMQGKLIRRQYLLDSGIRFNADTCFYEDSQFLTHANTCTKNIALLPAITYVRRCHASSMTSGNEYGNG